MKTKLKVLIVDDDHNMAHTLADILAISNFQPLEADSAEQALQILASEKADCVLTDVRMGGISGVELFEEIQKINPGLPVILMTAYAPDEQIRHGLRIGVIGLLTKPLEISQLLNFLSILSEDRCIAVVDDDPAFCKTITEILTRRGYCAKYVTDADKALEVITPQVQTILLDMKLNSLSGQEVLKKIHKSHKDIPVILITAYRQEMVTASEKGFAQDAFTCLYKPLDIPRLLKTLDELLKIRLKKSLSRKSARQGAS